MTVKLFLIGGFLGAGKTTLIRRLVRQLASRGERVAVVTNDQAPDLVDTRSVSSDQVPVEEVAGACFCCAFDDLVGRLESLQETALPTFILAEPVGSCTDLSATVLQPLKKFYGSAYRVLPYAVLVDPRRALRILTDQPRGGFSPKAAYIYRKQLEEADLIVMNKLDLVDRPTRERLRTVLSHRFPHARLLEISARTGEGVADLMAVVEGGDIAAGQHITDVDYDVYAEGEAELGWLNAVARFPSLPGLPLQNLTMTVAQRMLQQIRHYGADVAHLKVLGLGGGTVSLANHTGVEDHVVLSQPADTAVERAEVVMNVRAFLGPETLQSAWHETLESLRREGLVVEAVLCRSLRPGRPVPVHRFTTPV